jgi:predicted GNAT family acetyltransferase
MDPIRVQRQDYKTRGTYVVTIPGTHGIARLNYKHERPGLIIAEHTEISDTLKDSGAGLALVTRMVEDARKEGVKIYALCTYVEEQRRGHPEWADVFHVPSQGTAQ